MSVRHLRGLLPPRPVSVRSALYAVLLAASIGLALAAYVASRPAPLYIGVMLPLSGPDDIGWRDPLEWARETVNAAGGIDGRRIEFRYADIAVQDPAEVARAFASDDSIVAVIGPDKSSTLFDIAPTFIDARKPLVSSSSTSGDVTRAFSGTGFVWRTVESDIGQLQAMLLVAAQRGVTDIALLTSYDAYGATFFDWFGFFATELGMNVTEVARIEDSEDCAEPVSDVLASNPQLVLVVPPRRHIAVCIASKMRAQSDVPMLFSDGGMFPALLTDLGPRAEGLTGLTLAPDPSSGFADAYRARFGAPPPAYAANSYDAVLLLAYGLARSRGAGHDRLASAIVEVTGAEGPSARWDADGVHDALRAIRNGTLPDVEGATGDLDFGDRNQIDLTRSYFARWEVSGGAFQLRDVVSTSPDDHPGSPAADALFRGLASHDRQADLASSEDAPPLPERTGLWALIMATSAGWENYRHQADALGQYRLLRQAGVPDDHIILILADDIATAPENRAPGAVYHEVGGPDLRRDVDIDYRLREVSAAAVLDILAGRPTPDYPEVIASGPGDNVYVFIAGHGSRQGLFVGVDRAADRVRAGAHISPALLAETVDQMYAASRYRRMLLVFEACNAGVMGRTLTTPDALVLTGANPFENSVATRYAPDLDAWLGDQFAVAVTGFATRSPNASLGRLYREVYLEVAGSHVSAYNAANFGSLDRVALAEFITP